MTEERAFCRDFVVLLWGDDAGEEMDAMPVWAYDADRSHIVGTPTSAHLMMSRDASPMDWLHETAHYFSWLWFPYLRKDELSQAEVTRAELAAYLPHAALEQLGSKMASAWLAAAFPHLARRARRMWADREGRTLTQLMAECLRG